MKKISVIVPVYNAEKYLEKTLQALRAQTYQNLEIILIDDGSTDNSFALCQQAASEDGRITCCSIPNGGPSNARNIGLSKATGEYVGFCDSDDLPNESMYQTLAEYMESANADIAFCDIYSERDGRAFGFPWADKKEFEGEEISRQLIASMIGNLSDNERQPPVWGSVVRCLFQREILEKHSIQFPIDIHFAEDLVFVLRYLAWAKKAVICEKALYFYTCNDLSIMHSFYRYKKDMFQTRRALVSHIEESIAQYENMELRARLQVTERCYYAECVGNACREAEGRAKKQKKAELSTIVNDEAVKKAFRQFDAKDLKTRINYLLIKHRCVGLLYLYYTQRFK